MSNKKRSVFCPFCDEEINNTTGFCEHCNADLNPKANQSKNSGAKKVCKSCLRYIPQSSIYCPNCGRNPNARTNSRYDTHNEGSFFLGFLLSFFMGFIGLLIALCIDKRKTKNGAICVFIIHIILIAILIAVAIAINLGYFKR